MVVYWIVGKCFIYFPQINRMCSERGVFFTYVDLRWGITSEQTSDGKTIAICLQEVYMLVKLGKPTMWFLNRSDTNQAVQPQKQAGSLKFRI